MFSQIQIDSLETNKLDFFGQDNVLVCADVVRSWNNISINNF